MDTTHTPQHSPSDPAATAIDKRKSERLTLALPLAYVIDCLDRQLIGDSETVNLSGGGLQFLMSAMVPAGCACQVHVHLPEEDEPVTLAGRVIWCRAGQGEYGVQFEVAVAWQAGDACDQRTFARYCQFIATQLLKKYLG